MGKGGLGSFGIITIAMGHQRYERQAEILSLSLKHNMPGLPIAVVSDNPRLASIAELVIPPLQGVAVGVVQKLYLDHYTPFEETLFIDSDCIVTRPFHEELDQIRQFDFSPAMERVTPRDGQDESITDLVKTLEMVGGQKLSEVQRRRLLLQKHAARLFCIQHGQRNP